MKLIKIDPPGTWCFNDAVDDLINKCGGQTFIEVGCGSGNISKRLCQKGFTGTGIDFSEPALHLARENLKNFINQKKYQLIQDDIFEYKREDLQVDLGLSMMVIEHIEDDVGFVRKIAQFVRPGGHIIISVPGRRDCWGIEDETVGHLRRYDNLDLKNVLEEAGLENIEVWSVAVPVANILFHLGNYLIQNSNEIQKINQSKQDQTKTSGIREIPFKTVFPSWFRVILNQKVLYPFFILQKFFYQTNLGLTMMASGRVSHR